MDDPEKLKTAKCEAMNTLRTLLAEAPELFSPAQLVAAAELVY